MAIVTIHNNELEHPTVQEGERLLHIVVDNPMDDIYVVVPEEWDKLTIEEEVRWGLRHRFGKNHPEFVRYEDMTDELCTWPELAMKDAWDAWDGEGFYDIRWSDGGCWTSNGPVYCEDERALANAIEDAYPDSTDTHLPYAELAGKGPYQRHELESFLGDFAGEYDVDALEREVTAISSEGERYVKQSWLDLCGGDGLLEYLEGFEK